MSHDLDDLIVAELEQLRLLVESRHSLVVRSLSGPVELEMLDALSALLHSFYTAVERVLTHIAKREGVERVIQSNSSVWHSVLLKTMAEGLGGTGPVIGDELYGHLKEYLGFRHVFRHAYLHELQWSKMRGLVENLEDVRARVESEVKAYLKKV